MRRPHAIVIRNAGSATCQIVAEYHGEDALGRARIEAERLARCHPGDALWAAQMTDVYVLPSAPELIHECVHVERGGPS